jgi:DNA polymerase-3 subunit delta
MQELINESRKLIEYAGENGSTKKEDIDLLCIKEVNAVIFTLTDLLGKKDITKALETLKNLIYNKEPIQKILITLYNHFKKIYFTKLALEEKKDIAQVLNLKPNQIFLVSKYKGQAGYFSKEELKNILEELILLDKNSKIGLIDLNIGLESILSKYCS